MPTRNPLFAAHMLLLRWGIEREEREAEDAGEFGDRTASPADDHAQERGSALIVPLPGDGGKRPDR